MKVRRGFVSNSSSSSFMIGVKKGKLTKEKLLKIFNVPEKSPLSSIAKGLAEFFLEQGRQTLEEYLDGNCLGLDELDKDTKRIFKKCLEVYIGSAANDTDNPIETMLCDLSLNYEDDDIIIRKEGGF